MGRSPRTPTPVRARRSGAPLWPSTSPRRSRSPSTRPRRPSGSPMPGSGPPRPSAASASCRPASASPSRTAPPTEPPPASAWTRRRRAGSLPAGITRAAGAGCKRPPAPGGEWDKHSTTGPFFATKGGVACSPDPDPARQGRRSAIATGRTGSRPRGGAKALAKGGVALVAWQNGSGSGPAAVLSSPEPGQGRASGRDSRRDGDSGRWRAVFRSADGRDRREGPVHPRRGGGRDPEAAHRAAVRRCCMFPPLLHPVRLAVPDPAARHPRECANFPLLPSRIRDCRAVEEVAPDVTLVFGDRVYSPEITTTYEESAAVLRAACRPEVGVPSRVCDSAELRWAACGPAGRCADRRSAFQAGCVIPRSRVAPPAALRAACRPEVGVPSRVCHPAELGCAACGPVGRVPTGGRRSKPGV